MAASTLSIGALADQAGCSVPTIRYYEQIGLLPPAARTGAGHRHYRAADLQRLQFIKRCRDFGFPIEQVRELVGVFDKGEGDCAEVRDVAQAQLAAVRSRLAALRALEATLQGFVADCDAACVGGPSRDCCIIDELSSQAADASTVTELRRRA
ncbi:MAG: MerR family transcriptional regulator [Gammaproteobacteria bacterium]